MKKLTETQKTLLADLGIPENVAHLAPEPCTCGAKGCTEHESWGDRIMDSIFKGCEGTWDGTVPDLMEEIEKLKNFKFPETK